jgi:hypothetical protein
MRMRVRIGAWHHGRHGGGPAGLVQLLDLDERLRSFRKADLREQGFQDTPMPPYRDMLIEQEIADLVAISFPGAGRRLSPRRVRTEIPRHDQPIIA